MLMLLFLMMTMRCCSGHCAETAAGSEEFVREWSKATVTLYCGNWSSSIKMK